MSDKTNEILKGLEEIRIATTRAAVKAAAERVNKLIDELALEKEKGLCVICQKEKVFPKGDFDKCFSCAMDYRDQMHREFIAILSSEQFAVFEKYDKARGDFTSMVILD
jgi:hypothetical protein